MKIREAIDMIDDLKHNTYSESTKIHWLSRLDSMVKRLIIDTHECANNVTFSGYDENTDMETELLVPAPFDEVYLRWLEAQIDYANGEYDKYNNAILMYQTAYDGYANYYNRTHMPVGRKIDYFGKMTKPYQSSNSVVKVSLEEA
jgi:hypothetical protein